MKYAITGLPRMKSAFMANMLTYGDSFCFHDAWNGLDRVDDIRGKLESQIGDKPITNVGISDPALLLFWREMDEWYPDAKWVVIERDFEDVVESCEKFGARRQQLSSMLYRLEALKSKLNPMVVRFEDLGTNCAQNIADYIGVDIGPKERLEMLCRFNVQIHPEHLNASIIKVLANRPSFLNSEVAA